jgi:septal ring factor EnvC (AmiA/AmiB activator)
MADLSLLKDIGIPVLTCIVGALGTILAVRSRERSDANLQEVQRASVKMTTQVARDQARMTYDASTAQTLTERFKALMDGYEARINDLTQDIKEQRIRVRTLEANFNTHRSICNGCENYEHYMKDHPNAFSSS